MVHVRVGAPHTPMEMQFSSPPDGNLTMNLEPAFSSESFSGRNLQTTLMLSSAAISRSLGVSIAIASGGDGDYGDDDDEGACVCTRARASMCVRMYLALDWYRRDRYFSPPPPPPPPSLRLRLFSAASDYSAAIVRRVRHRRRDGIGAYRMKGPSSTYICFLLSFPSPSLTSAMHSAPLRQQGPSVTVLVEQQDGG